LLEGIIIPLRSWPTMPFTVNGLKKQKFESPAERVFFCSPSQGFEKSRPVV
jgi:hypothetical protein